MLHWLREKSQGEFNVSKPEHKYLLLLAGTASHQGHSLIIAILTGNTAPSAMLTRGLLETSKRFVDTIQNGITPFISALNTERGQLSDLKDFQKNARVHTFDPSSQIFELDKIASTLNPTKIDAKEKTLTELLGREAKEYWKLLSIDIHGRPSSLARQYGDLVTRQRIDSVCTLDTENTNAQLDIASFALYKMASSYFDSNLVASNLRTPLRSKLDELYAL